MYIFVRFIFAVIIFFIFHLIIKKTKIVNKSTCYVILIFMLSVFIYVLYSIPVENRFISFPSAEKAFTYKNKQTSKDILCVVDGIESSLIVAKKNDEQTRIIFPKVEDGWKLNEIYGTKLIAIQNINSISIYIFKYKDSRDYYIEIHDIYGGETEITDNRNSQFQCVKGEFIPALGQTMFYYYACVQSTDDEYIISLNGEEVVLSLTENIPPTTVLNTEG